MTIELLLAQLDFDTFTEDSLEFVRANHPTNISTPWEGFCKRLKSIATDELSLTEKLILGKLALTCLKNGINDDQLDQLITAAMHTKSIFGPFCYYSVFTSTIPDNERCIAHYLKFYQVIESLKDDAKIIQVLFGLEEGLKAPQFGGSFTKFIDSLCADQRKNFGAKYPSRPVSEVLAAFTRVDDHLQYPLNPLELKELSDEFTALEALKESLISCTLDELRSSIQNHAKLLKEKPKLVSAKVQVLASLRELIRRHFHIFPHDTQMMALLGILNKPESLRGRIAQVKTGEGKSTLVAILAAYLGVQGQFVDIVSSNEYLATRDAAKYKEFYASIGLKSGDICGPDPKKEDFNPPILFATVSDIKFSILRDELYHQERRYSARDGVLVPRTLDVVIADEIDTLVDTALNAAYLAVDSPEDHRWVYEPVLSFVRAHKGLFINESDIERLREKLQTVHKGRYQDEAAGFTKERLASWMSAAKTALNYSEHIHYEIEPTRTLTSRGYVDVPTVKIVDHANTGRISEGCRWTGGIHEFVEIKHGIQPGRERHTAASLSHPSLFNSYTTLFGLTGTMGGDVIRTEVREVFQVDSFDVPPHIPNKRINLGLQVLDDTKQQFEAIYQVLLTKTKKSAGFFSLFSTVEEAESCLVLFNTIQDTMAFAAFLKSKKIAFQLLNERQDECEEEVIKRAAYPGVITVATNMAGRGTDILAKKLHVIFADFASNDRVEAQGNGRSARQGKEGSCEAILSLKSSGLLSLCSEAELPSRKESLPPAEFNAFLYETREKRTRLESEQRKRSLVIEAYCYSKLEDFFKRLKTVHKEFESTEIKAKLITACEGFLPSSEAVEAELDEAYDSVVAYAKTLLDQKSASASVDWNSLIKQYKEVFIEQMIQKWAKFYTQLRVYQHEDFSVAKPKIEADCARLQADLVCFNIEALFKVVLAYTQLVAVVTKDAAAGTAKVDAEKSAVPSKVDLLRTKYKLSPADSLEKILHKAAAVGDKGDVLFLVSEGADIDAREDNPQSKKTALHLATQNGHEVVVQFLVSAGANLNIRDAAKNKAEAYAKKKTILEVLHKESLEMTFFGASSQGVEAIIHGILSKYQTVDIKMPTLEQALYQAVSKDAVEDVFQLLKTKVNINQIDSVTRKAPLHEAVEKGHLTIVRLLLAAKASTRVVDGDGVSANDYLAKSCLEDMRVFNSKIRAELKQCPIVNILVKYGCAFLPDVYPLSFRKASVQGNDRDIFLLLTFVNSVLNSQDDSKKTALHLAIENGKVNAARLLIQMGAAMDIKDAADKTAAEYLAESTLEGMKVLSVSGVSVESLLDKYKMIKVATPTPAEALHKIAEAGDDDSLMSLLELSDVDVDAQDEVSKKTALHYAVQNGRATTTQILLGFGVRTDIRDSNSKHAAEYLTPSSSSEMQALFENKSRLGLGPT